MFWQQWENNWLTLESIGLAAAWRCCIGFIAIRDNKDRVLYEKERLERRELMNDYPDDENVPFPNMASSGKKKVESQSGELLHTKRDHRCCSYCWDKEKKIITAQDAWHFITVMSAWLSAAAWPLPCIMNCNLIGYICIKFSCPTSSDSSVDHHTI